MTRSAQNLLMILVGGTVLWITLVTGEVVDYVKPGLRYPLVAAALVLIALGAAGIRRDWREGDPGDHDGPADHDGHGHGPGGPRVAWLLCLPVLVVFAIAPPELGVFTATRADARPAPPPSPVPRDEYALPAGPDPLPLAVSEFMGRSFEAQVGGKPTLQDRRVVLTGFVTPHKRGGWSVTRLQLNCCAADATALRVTVLDAPAPAKGSWVSVTGVWLPAGGAEDPVTYRIRAQDVSPAEKPPNAYE